MAMNFEESLRYELSSIAAIADKVYPLNAPEQAVEPFVIYTSSEGQREQSLITWDNMRELNCEIQTITLSYAEMKTIQKLIIDKVLSWFNRRIALSGVYIRDLSYDAPVEMYDNQLKQYRSILDIRVRY